MRKVEKKGGLASHVKAPPLPAPPPVVDANRHQWGCTDLIPVIPKKEPAIELRPDPLPEYITPTQARKWGISIRFPKELA